MKTFKKIIFPICLLIITGNLVLASEKGKPTKLSSDNLYVNMGILAAESGKPDSALIYLTKAIEINKKNPYAYYVRATIYYEQEKFDLAIQDLNNSIKINSNDEKPLYLRAAINQNQRNFQAAIEDYKKLLKINPKDTGYLFNYAYCLQETKDFDKSTEIYKKYESLVKIPSIDFYTNIIYNFVNLQNLDEALNYIIKFEKNGYKTKEITNLKINILANSGECNQAELEFERNFDLIDNASYILSNIGMCYLKNQNFLSAQKFLSKAYSIDKSLVEHLYNLGYIQHKLGNNQQSLSYFEQFLEESKNRKDLKMLREQASKNIEEIRKANINH